MVSYAQVGRHNSQRSCWVVIRGRVYDVTSFLSEHPGGKAVILAFAGKDATASYDAVHPPDLVQQHLLPIGTLDTPLPPSSSSKQQPKKSIPPLSQILNANDFEQIALSTLPQKAGAYYSSGADSEISLHENIHAFSRLFFLPRILRPVSQISTSTTLLSLPSSLPFYISFTGLAKLGHPQGDINITKAAGRAGILQMVGTNPSTPHSEIISHTLPSQSLLFQLYKHPSLPRAESLIRSIEKMGYKALFLTVDAPVLGKRERDERAAFELADALDPTAIPYFDEEDPEDEEGDGDGIANAFSKQDDPDKTWNETIPWLRRTTKLPIVLKGIQSVEDALLAVEAGVDGIVLSNHGGRQLDYAPSSISTLYKLRKSHPEVFTKLEVYIDGGIRRGTDILKALCLGARAVGIGRPFVYASSAYGEAGVLKLIRIFEREIVTGMRLLGARDLSELREDMVVKVDWQPKL